LKIENSINNLRAVLLAEPTQKNMKTDSPFLAEATRKNMAMLSEKNSINTGFSIEYDYYKKLGEENKVFDAYKQLVDLIAEIKDKTNYTKPIEDQIVDAYALIKSKYEIKANHNQLFVESLKNKTLDCDTMAFVIIALANELKQKDSRWNDLGTVSISRHVLLNYRGIYIDNGYKPSVEDYMNAPFNLNPRNAKELLSNVTPSDKTPLLFLLNVGNAYAEKKMYTEAITGYTNALKIAPKDVLTLNNLGLVYADMGYANRDRAYTEKAINCFKDVLKEDPYDKEALHNLASVYIDMGNYFQEINQFDEALNWYGESLKINDRDSTALFNIGMIDFKKGDIDGAKKMFEEVIFIDPKSERAQYMLGYSLFTKGDLDLAIRVFENVLKINPKKANTWYMLAEIYNKKGNISKEKEFIRKALDIDPRHKGALKLQNALK